MWYKKQDGSLIQIKDNLYTSESTKIINNDYFRSGIEDEYKYVYQIWCKNKLIFETESLEERKKEFEKISQKLLTR